MNRFICAHATCGTLLGENDARDQAESLVALISRYHRKDGGWAPEDWSDPRAVDVFADFLGGDLHWGPKERPSEVDEIPVLCWGHFAEIRDKASALSSF